MTIPDPIHLHPQESLDTLRLHGDVERDLDAMGRTLSSGSVPPMPDALAGAVRARATRSTLRITGTWLAAAACVSLGGLALLQALRHDGNQARGPVHPIASIPISGAGAIASTTSIASLKAATQGLDGAAMLDSLPGSTSGASSESVWQAAPRAGEPLDSPRARAVLGSD